MWGGIFLWWQLCISWQHGNLAIPRVATGTTDLGLALFGARPSNAAQELICHKLPTISSIFGKSNDKDFVCFSDTSPLLFTAESQIAFPQNPTTNVADLSKFLSSTVKSNKVIILAETVGNICDSVLSFPTCRSANIFGNITAYIGFHWKYFRLWATTPLSKQ